MLSSQKMRFRRSLGMGIDRIPSCTTSSHSWLNLAESTTFVRSSDHSAPKLTTTKSTSHLEWNWCRRWTLVSSMTSTSRKKRWSAKILLRTTMILPTIWVMATPRFRTGQPHTLLCLIWSKNRWFSVLGRFTWAVTIGRKSWLETWVTRTKNSS